MSSKQESKTLVQSGGFRNRLNYELAKMEGGGRWITWRCRCVDGGREAAWKTGQKGRGAGKQWRKLPTETSHRLMKHSGPGCVMLNKGGVDLAQCSDNELLLI